MSGEMNHNPARIFQQFLIDLGGLVVEGGTVGDWPCYEGMMPNTPDDCVAITDTAGIAQGRDMPTGYFTEEHGAVIRIRSDGPVDGYVKGARILAAIQTPENTLVTVADDVGTASSQYRIQSVRPVTGVIRLGPEKGESRRFIWTLNVMANLRLT